MRSRLVTPIGLAGLVVATTICLTACGSDDADDSSDGASSDTTVFVGDYEIVSDAAVAQGLASTSAEMVALVATPESATADAVLLVYEDWGSYEGTIQQNEPESYLALEDALGVFKRSAENGDAVGMQTAITEFGAQAAQYLIAHPG